MLSKVCVCVPEKYDARFIHTHNDNGKQDAEDEEEAEATTFV